MTPKIALSIAGSDPSGGAGIQADLKTFSALGAYGCAALAGLTVQNTQGVRAAIPVDPRFVRDQIVAVIEDLPIAATKLGMLSNAEVAGAVADLIEERRDDFGVIVLDPVMVATSGDRLLSDDAVETVRARLMPLADVVTPNLPEAAVLLGEAPAQTVGELGEQASALVTAGARAALVKGGHMAGDELTDAFADSQGLMLLRGPRVDTRNTHGTGCTLSSAIAASAALLGDTRVSGVSLAAVERARGYLLCAIVAGADWRLSRTPDTGHGPVNHLIEGARVNPLAF
ncbi:MAG: bifunctional hydroxymethylpyrimidine kinase/phosphomethylpyrimidine kinase [Tessaracoccus sp.]|uniref:bifunctional hydroxymethylpyrimidine kinase/phosphomethylpyrimidine kinase n=1 Tax=Tessaracoccus sp. TaxID=1971211 RepID=UPI001EC11085|nr:bifunctional hydroxymethylpyrimidine kinase/phosphomethylpyrimidine kinase [Tessaracoccus sp.]MBK7820037.1 bifunctional hydroxymethylpyrimidine kinase/phosphomethylpyrimidine kinase [Tessaracoccus sp.]